jgi:hypothetical protein
MLRSRLMRLLLHIDLQLQDTGVRGQLRGFEWLSG